MLEWELTSEVTEDSSWTNPPKSSTKSAHPRQSTPDCGLGVRVDVLKSIQGVPSSLGKFTGRYLSRNLVGKAFQFETFWQ